MAFGKLIKQIAFITLLLMLSILVGSCVKDTSLRDAQSALEARDVNAGLCHKAQKKFPNDPNVGRCERDAIGNRYLHEAVLIMKRSANYNFPYPSESTAYDNLIEASRLSPEYAEASDVLSQDWADQFWNLTKEYWRESEYLWQEFSKAIEALTLISSEKQSADQQTRVMELHTKFTKKQDLAFMHFLIMERMFPTYSWHRCAAEISPSCSQIRREWESFFVPRISLPVEAPPDASHRDAGNYYEIADLARRGTQSRATVFSVGTKGSSEKDYGILRKILADEYRHYRPTGGSAAICLRPDMPLGVEVRPLRQLSKDVDVVDYARLIFSAVEGLECHSVLLKDATEQTTTHNPAPNRMNNRTINKLMSNKIVKIHVDVWFGRSGSSGGTGFAVNDRGYVITNYHVVCPTRVEVKGNTKKYVDDCTGIGRPTRMQVRWLDRAGTEQTARASLVDAWRDEDLAVLLVLPQGTLDAEQRLSPLSFAVYKPDPLLEVLSYGYPGVASFDRAEGSVESLTPTVTDGIVSRLIERPWMEKRQKLTVVQHTAAITNGNSGGPVIDRCGRVVGVNTLGFILGEKDDKLTLIPGSINFAAFAGDVVRKLEQLEIHYIAGQGHCSEIQPHVRSRGAREQRQSQ